MIHHENGHISLDLVEIIRLNQLVRNDIDIAAFRQWYDELSAPEQCALITALEEFAGQAGYDESTFIDANAKAGLDPADTVIRTAFNFRGGYSREHGTNFSRWLPQLNETQRRTLFRFYVYLFGLAEGAVYRSELRQGCNHWWHRDLLDERVVKDLLENPRFWSTSMQDDEALKAEDDVTGGVTHTRAGEDT